MSFVETVGLDQSNPDRGKILAKLSHVADSVTLTVGYVPNLDTECTPTFSGNDLTIGMGACVVHGKSVNFDGNDIITIPNITPTTTYDIYAIINMSAPDTIEFVRSEQNVTPPGAIFDNLFRYYDSGIYYLKMTIVTVGSNGITAVSRAVNMSRPRNTAIPAVNQFRITDVEDATAATRSQILLSTNAFGWYNVLDGAVTGSFTTNSLGQAFCSSDATGATGLVRLGQLTTQNTFDSGWVTVNITQNTTRINNYLGTGPAAQIRRVGNVVHFRGAWGFVIVGALTTTTTIPIATLDAQFRPTRQFVAPRLQASGNGSWYMDVTSAGVINIGRHSTTNAPINEWLPFGVSWLVG